MTKYVKIAIVVKEKDEEDLWNFLDTFPFWNELSTEKRFENKEREQ